MDNAGTLTSIRNLARKVAPQRSNAILYGSRARGTARKGSDWDILWILDKDTLTQKDYDAVSYPLVLLGCELNEEINPILYTAKEWQSYSATPFYENVVRDGINLLQSRHQNREFSLSTERKNVRCTTWHRQTRC